ncbi:hypothetical protein SH668x_001498 [Planctomicrobium sp. SH668]|uniref:hypothetical protein n=1 Tax=Planctomicrobium sp. SH668 TaxID=3448126 RepID=UPI003F5BE427
MKMLHATATLAVLSTMSVAASAQDFWPQNGDYSNMPNGVICNENGCFLPDAHPGATPQGLSLQGGVFQQLDVMPQAGIQANQTMQAQYFPASVPPNFGPNPPYQLNNRGWNGAASIPHPNTDPRLLPAVGQPGAPRPANWNNQGQPNMRSRDGQFGIQPVGSQHWNQQPVPPRPQDYFPGQVSPTHPAVLPALPGQQFPEQYRNQSPWFN